VKLHFLLTSENTYQLSIKTTIEICQNLQPIYQTAGLEITTEGEAAGTRFFSLPPGGKNACKAAVRCFFSPFSFPCLEITTEGEAAGAQFVGLLFVLFRPFCCFALVFALPHDLP